MAILVKKDNQWLTIKNIYYRQNNQWQTIKGCYVKLSDGWQSIWENVIIFINYTPQTSINISELMGSPVKKGNYTFINNAEIHANYGEPALRTGIFPQGSKLIIINNSYIRGHGGNGGSSNSDGEPGGDAILIEYPCNIDNSYGYLYAGGGGGGGMEVGNNGTLPTWSKTGGGGGAGCIAGITSEGYSCSGFTTAFGANPSDGTMEKGGLGGHVGGAYNPQTAFRYDAGNGGDIGINGTSAQWISGTKKGGEKLYVGGTAGLAINKNGFEINLLNLHNQRIKGEIQ